MSFRLGGLQSLVAESLFRCIWSYWTTGLSLENIIWRSKEILCHLFSTRQACEIQRKSLTWKLMIHGWYLIMILSRIWSNQMISKVSPNCHQSNTMRPKSEALWRSRWDIDLVGWLDIHGGGFWRSWHPARWCVVNLALMTPYELFLFFDSVWLVSLLSKRTPQNKIHFYPKSAAPCIICIHFFEKLRKISQIGINKLAKNRNLFILGCEKPQVPWARLAEVSVGLLEPQLGTVKSV